MAEVQEINIVEFSRSQRDALDVISAADCHLYPRNPKKIGIIITSRVFFFFLQKRVCLL